MFHNVLRQSRYQASAWLVVWLCAALLLPSVSQARPTTCRKDPIVSLSNGKTLLISEVISTAANNVTQVTYIVHAPKGTTITKITYTGGASTSAVENVIFYADLAPDSYTTEIVVTTTQPHIPVTAKTIIGKTSGTVSGFSGQSLLVRLTVR
jgi:hypothetical protein